jgi:hypothetical protein
MIDLVKILSSPRGKDWIVDQDVVMDEWINNFSQEVLINLIKIPFVIIPDQLSHILDDAFPDTPHSTQDFCSMQGMVPPHNVKSPTAVFPFLYGQHFSFAQARVRIPGDHDIDERIASGKESPEHSCPIRFFIHDKNLGVVPGK